MPFPTRTRRAFHGECEEVTWDEMAADRPCSHMNCKSTISARTRTPPARSAPDGAGPVGGAGIPGPRRRVGAKAKAIRTAPRGAWRAGVDGALQHSVDPGRDGAAFVQHAQVAQALHVLHGAHAGIPAIGQYRTASGRPARPGQTGRSARWVVRPAGIWGGVLQGAQHLGRGVGAGGVVQAGHLHAAEVDDAHGAAAVNHQVLGPQVLVQHLQPVKACRPRAICSTMSRTASSSGRGWSRIHCARVWPSTYSVARRGGARAHRRRACSTWGCRCGGRSTSSIRRSSAARRPGRGPLRAFLSTASWWPPSVASQTWLRWRLPAHALDAKAVQPARRGRKEGQAARACWASIRSAGRPRRAPAAGRGCQGCSVLEGRLHQRAGAGVQVIRVGVQRGAQVGGAGARARRRWPAEVARSRASSGSSRPAGVGSPAPGSDSFGFAADVDAWWSSVSGFQHGMQSQDALSPHAAGGLRPLSRISAQWRCHGPGRGGRSLRRVPGVQPGIRVASTRSTWSGLQWSRFRRCRSSPPARRTAARLASLLTCCWSRCCRPVASTAPLRGELGAGGMWAPGSPADRACGRPACWLIETARQTCHGASILAPRGPGSARVGARVGRVQGQAHEVFRPPTRLPSTVGIRSTAGGP